MIVTRAPLRLAIGGGGTDLPFYSTRFGGFLISAAINKYNYIIVEKRDFSDEFFIRYAQTEIVKSVKDIKHTRIKAALEYLGINEPIEITALADVPAGTGLGNSSTFLVALLKALHAYKREDVSAKKLAEEAADIEINILGEPTGKQDQYMAAYGGILTLNIAKNGGVIASPPDISHSTLEELDNNLLLFSTGYKRSSAEVIQEQKKNVEADDKKLEQMHQIKNIGLEIKKALEAGETAKVGKWFNVHWESKKAFGKQMSNDKINEYYDIALRNGAIGGKLVGAGGGGFLLFYSEPDKKRQLRNSMAALGLKELPFRFDTEGCKIVYDGK
jgi:D-glycero-alpha-D-manno-heptose-7-phosphate kinase